MLDFLLDAIGVAHTGSSVPQALDHTFQYFGMMVRVEVEVSISMGGFSIYRCGHPQTLSPNKNIQEGDLVILLLLHSELDRVSLAIEVFQE